MPAYPVRRRSFFGYTGRGFAGETPRLRETLASMTAGRAAGTPSQASGFWHVGTADSARTTQDTGWHAAAPSRYVVDSARLAFERVQQHRRVVGQIFRQGRHLRRSAGGQALQRGLVHAEREEGSEGGFEEIRGSRPRTSLFRLGAQVAFDVSLCVLHGRRL